MIVLDTNVISELMRPQPDQAVIGWLDRQLPSDVWATSISIFEIGSGLTALPDGRRKSALKRGFNTLRATILRTRILPLDEKAADIASELSVRQFRSGQNVELNDRFIAGIVLANDALLATRNVRHFHEIGERLVNPWEA